RAPCNLVRHFPPMSSSDASNRPAPATQGRLAKTPVWHLLLYAQERMLTGSIELVAPDGESAAILFLEGQPTKVRSSVAVAYLGRMLMELGHITETQLNQTLSRIAQTKRLHGQLLIESGIIDEK